MKRLSAERLRELLGEVTIVDTRPAAPAGEGPLPGAIPLSLEQAQAGELPELPKDTPIVVVCERGQISELVGLYLEAADFRDVSNLAGGMRAWRALAENS